MNINLPMPLPELLFCEEFFGDLKRVQSQISKEEKKMDLNISLATDNLNSRIIANDTLLNTNNQTTVAMEDSFSTFDTFGFPTSIEDLDRIPDLYYESNLTEMMDLTSYSTSEATHQSLLPFKRSISIVSTWSNLSEDVTETLTLPVVPINDTPCTEYKTLALANSESQNIPTTATESYYEYKKSPAAISGSDSESLYSPSSCSEMSDFEDAPKRRRSSGGNSSTYSNSDLDLDYEPEFPSRPIKRPTKRPKRSPKTCQHKPNPQNRAPGTSLKITQWILKLLDDQEYNPRVISWVDENQRKFKVQDTDEFARLWGKHKKNENMTYEKLSRSMRYSYKNQELVSVKNVRLTYKFGPAMKFRPKNLCKTNNEKYLREA